MDVDERPKWKLTRQCTAHNRTGGRCERNAIVGGAVCSLHGGSVPQVKAAARLRLVAMVEPVLNVFEDILTAWHRTRCTTCGFPTGDPAPVIRVGQLILDRAGYHPTLTLETHAAPNEFADATDDELIEQLENMLREAKARRDERDRSERALTEAIEAEVLLDDGIDFEDEPKGPSPVQRQAIFDETGELPKKTDDG